MVDEHNPPKAQSVPTHAHPRQMGENKRQKTFDKLLKMHFLEMRRHD